MNILVAPDSFKGSLTSKQICDIAKESIVKVLPDCKVMTLPMADGGEGTVDSLVLNTGGKYIKKVVKGPYGEPVMATYGILGDKKTAVIEMASASGLALANQDKLNPLVASTYGTGELVLDAISKGCRKIIMGIGGSATNDAAMGMMMALGFKFKDKDGEIVKEGARSLGLVSEIVASDALDSLRDTVFEVACDVDNPLCGEKGATHIYGPQKGATKEMIEEIEKGMCHFGKLLETTFNKPVMDVEGAGAAGGMGAGLLAFLNATLKSGFKIISNTIKLEEIIKENHFDLIITGEGQLNYQTLHGKLPYGISSLGKKYNIPVIAIVGSIGDGYEPMYDVGLTSVFSIISQPMNLKEAMQNAKKLTANLYENIIRTFQYTK